MPSSSTGLRIVIITGAEGAGKSTVMRALHGRIDDSAMIDAENLGAVTPFRFDDAFLTLLWKNAVDVIANFAGAGYRTIITGSFLDGDRVASLSAFLQKLRASVEASEVIVVHLQVSRAQRDLRRIAREKPSTPESRAAADAGFDEADVSLRDGAAEHGYRYVGVDSTDLGIEATLARIESALSAR